MRSTPSLTFPALQPLYVALEAAAYALLRLAFGIIIATHGLPKLLGTSHGSMADPMAGSTNLIENVLHLPAAPAFAMFVAILEGIGGALLAAGLWTRWIAALLTVEMLGISVALGPTWIWIDRGIEYPVLMLFLAAYMTLRGSGRYSIDRAIGKEL